MVLNFSRRTSLLGASLKYLIAASQFIFAFFWSCDNLAGAWGGGGYAKGKDAL
jgi:hypothetical protein